ncbi:agmatinase [Bifidobacterium callitrichos]|nr:agmatinase [Bifidobacterium callitrichos]
MTGNTGEAATTTASAPTEAEEYWPKGFSVKNSTFDTSIEGHGAVDDYNKDRKPGPIWVSRKHDRRFGGIQTFAKLPVCLTPEDLVAGKMDAAVYGVPWDSSVSGRSGAVMGPMHIRTIDYLGQNTEIGRGSMGLETHVNPFETLNVCDFGDAPIVRGNTPKSFDAVRRFVGAIVETGTMPIAMGGDHGMTWPVVTALADHYGFGKIGVVHFDAHCDAWEEGPDCIGGHGTPMRHLIESGAVPGTNFVQVGLRGYSPDQSLQNWMAERGMRCHFMAEIESRGFDAVLQDAVSEAMDQADYLYLSLDIDVVDPAFAPATGTPEPGGLRSWDVLTAFRRLAAEVGIIGMEVVEVAPPYDGPGEITSLLANRLIRSGLTGVAMHKLGIREPNYLHPEAVDFSLARKRMGLDH